MFKKQVTDASDGAVDDTDDGADEEEEQEEELEVVGEVSEEEKRMVLAEETLRRDLAKIKNRDSTFAKLPPYQVQQLFAIQCYLSLRLNGKGKMKASAQAAAERWLSQTEHAARCIRQWSQLFVHFGELPTHAQGKHAKRESLLNDEDVKVRCLSWLRTTDARLRSPAGLKVELESKILPDVLGVEGKTISSVTVGKFLKLWGFSKKKSGQQVKLE